MDPVSYPDNNIIGVSYINKSIIGGDDWRSAKKGIDFDAGNRIVNQLWKDKKTELLKNSIHDKINTILITIPSTSRTNILPVCFADKLYKDTGISYEVGEKYFSPLHDKETKLVSRLEKPFYQREYKINDKAAFDEKFKGKSVIIIDDILTTGGSVRCFHNALEQNGVMPSSVVALMGDKRLTVDEKTTETLSISLKTAGFDFDAGKIAKQITRTEARLIIMAVNNARSENARHKLSEKLQRLLDRGVVKDMERNQDTSGYESQQRGDTDNARISERIQTRNIQQTGGAEENLNHNIGSGQDKLQTRPGRRPEDKPGSKIEPVIRNRESVGASIEKTHIIKDSPYLESKGILSTTLNNPRFAGMIRQDNHQNIIFPHRDHEGISGAEIKNHDFTGFMKGGTKAVWHSKTTPDDRMLVITESGIDALSYHQIKGDQYTRYLSVGGTMSMHQEEIIKAAINKMPAGSEIIAGFNKNVQGERFFERIKILAPHANIKREVPAIGKDWSEQLQDMLRNRTPAKGPVRELLRW